MSTYLVVINPGNSTYPSIGAENRGFRFIGKPPSYSYAEFDAPDDETAKTIFKKEFADISSENIVLCKKIA